MLEIGGQEFGKYSTGTGFYVHDILCGLTILYASKSKSANREYKFVQEFLKREEQRYGQDYGAGGLVGQLLSRFKDAASWQNVYDRNTARSGSSSRNGAVYSQNRRDKLNAAFLSCIKNISEIQLQASIDERYQFAVDIEDYETAQHMVYEAAKAAGYTEEVFHGMGNRHNVYQSGHGQYGDGVYFTYDQPTARGYGKVVDHLFVKIGKIANYDDAYCDKIRYIFRLVV